MALAVALFVALVTAPVVVGEDGDPIDTLGGKFLSFLRR